MKDAAYYADLRMQVVGRDGQIHLLFSREVEGELRPAEVDNMRIPPDQAVAMAQVLTDLAFEADTSLKPVAPTLKASLVEKHRQKLIPRIVLMLNTLRENKHFSNEKIATQVMDAVCSEVFS